MDRYLRLWHIVGGEVKPFPNGNKDDQVILTDFTYTAKRMGGSPTITAEFMYPKCLDDVWGDSVFTAFPSIVNGTKFFLKRTPSSSYSNSDARYKHEIELVCESSILDHVLVYDVVPENSPDQRPVSNSTEFSFYGDIHEFANRLTYSLHYRNINYYVVVDDGIQSESKFVEFSNAVFSDAIKEAYNTYGIPYYIEGNRIHIGYSKKNVITHTFQYGIDYSLLSVQRVNANNKIITNITGVGSEDNIPYYYPNDYESKQQVIDMGGTWIKPQKRLMPSIYRKTEGAERFYAAENGKYKDPDTEEYYVFDNVYSPSKVREHIEEYDDVKPSIVGMTNAKGERIDMFSEFAYDLNDNDDLDDEGNYKHPYFFAKMRKTDGEFGFNLFDHAIDENEMTISMTSGNCGACEWTLMVDSETKKNLVQVDRNGQLVRDGDGNVVFGNAQPEQNNTQAYEVWVALKKEESTFGVVMPNATNNYRPSKNDTFVILHILLPKAYILAAEKRLEDLLIKQMYENNKEKFNFSISFSRIFFAENAEILDALNENSRIQIEYNNARYELYVDSFTCKQQSSSPLPEISVDLVDELSVKQNAIESAVSQVKMDMAKALGSVDVLKAGLRYFLRKDVPDTAHGQITHKQKSIHEQGAQFGKQYIGGLLGTGGSIDGEGNAELRSLSLREWLEVPELRYNKVSIYTGIRWDTFGGGIIESITPDGDGSATGQGVLKLEEGEYGAIEVGDLCMGIWHDTTGNAEETTDDHRGNFTFAGFKTVYFEITAVSGADNSRFAYTLRSSSDGGNGIHPFAKMHFACRGNVSNEARRAFTYTTTEYSLALVDVGTWDFQPSNYSSIHGNIEGFSMPAVNDRGEEYSKVFHGHGQVFGNAYIFGQIDAFERVAYRCFISQSMGGSIAPGEEEEVTVTILNGYGENVTAKFTLFSVTRNTGDEASDALWNSRHTNVGNPFIIAFSDLGIDGIRKTVATFFVTASDEGTGDVAKAATATYFI